MAQGKKMGVRERLARARENASERSKLFRELCQHIKEGFSIDSWGWMRPELVEEWFKTYPCEFIQDDFAKASSEARHMWEQIGKGQSNGTCHGNAQAWKFNMTNRFKWVDKINIDADIKGAVSVEVVSYASQQAACNSVSGVIT